MEKKIRILFLFRYSALMFLHITQIAHVNAIRMFSILNVYSLTPLLPSWWLSAKTNIGYLTPPSIDWDHVYLTDIGFWNNLFVYTLQRGNLSLVFGSKKVKQALSISWSMFNIFIKSNQFTDTVHTKETTNSWIKTHTYSWFQSNNAITSIL